MRIHIRVPGVDGWVSLLSVRRLAAQSPSYLTVAGDFRRKPLSDRYADLTAVSGPLASHGAAAVGGFELQSTGAFRPGRSWEAGVALAHVAIAEGMVLSADPENCACRITISGMVDSRLNVLPDGTGPLLTDRGPAANVTGRSIPELLFCPAEAGTGGDARPWQPVATISEIVDRIRQIDNRTHGLAPPTLPDRRTRHVFWAVPIIALLSALPAVYILTDQGDRTRQTSKPPSLTLRADVAPVADAPVGPSPAPAFRLAALDIQAGQSCASALFASDRIIRRMLQADGADIRPDGDTLLCGIDVEIDQAGGPRSFQLLSPQTMIIQNSQPGTVRNSYRRASLFLRNAVEDVAITIRVSDDNAGMSRDHTFNLRRR